MRQNKRRYGTALLAVGALLALGVYAALALTGVASASGREPNVVEVNVAARQWAWEPGVIEVNQGDLVRLNLMSLDVVHGFYLDGYGIDEALVAGQPVTIEFVADKPGRWMFRCSEVCGPFHPYMIGWLRVSPNWYARSSLIGVALLAAGSIGGFLLKVVKS